VEVAIFPCFEIFLKVFFTITQKSLVKNCVLANNKGNVLRREKNFEITLEFKIFSETLLQVHGYP